MIFEPRATHRLFIPDAPRPFPLLLFLHGAGERGDDNLAQTTVGLGPAVAREPARFPMAIVFPQCARDGYWRAPELDVALSALDDAMRELDADAERVYLSGISMGGYGAFSLALREPDRFAAVVPVCGGVARDVEHAAERLAHLPMWIFHGENDDIIPVDASRTIVAALRARGTSVRYTEYPGVRHNSWDRAYAEPELVPWLLAQNRSARST